MRNVFKTLLLITVVLITACESENRRSSGATGMLGISLVASNDVISTTTRTADGEDGGGANTEDDDLAPEVGDFKVALMDGNVVKTSWDKFSEYPKYAVLPVGSYTLKAYYGDVNVEGFESPYYEGTQSVVIEDDATIDASITCYLTNVKVSVEYTDAFKKYFSDYSTTVQSAGGTPVVFTKEEVRAAYVKPGVITVYSDIVKQDGKKAKLEILTIDQAKPREFYKLKLDIDAGSSTLKISFDNTTVVEPIEINVSDDVLNMQPPFFTASGYVPGIVQEMKEGSAISPLSMLITARNGIKKCVLTTQSTSLVSQGWPTSIDLVNPDAEILKKMKSLGLSMRGFTANIDKMATLDFSEVTSYLQHISGDDESSFSLVVTDKIGRVNDADEVIKVKALDNQFAVGAVDNVDLGVNEVTIPVTLDGDISKVKFQYLKDNSWLDINVSNIATEGIQHKVKLALSFMATSDFQIKVICGARSLLVAVGVNPPVFMLQASEADVWATKATIHVVGKNEGTTEYMKTQPVVIEYIKNVDFETGNWIVPEQTKDGNVITITGLPKDSEKTNTYKLKAKSGEMWSTNILDITTEKALQVPNAGFESWYERWLFKNTIFLSGGEDMYAFYPYAESEGDKWWSTRNDRTTQAYSGVASWYYCSFPGTVPTAKTGWTAYNHLIKYGGQSSLKIEAHTGSTAMEISTVGHGANNWTSQSAAQNDVDYRTPGALFIGTFDRSSQVETLGHKFESRPSAIEFYYKFYSYNNESAEAYAILYDEQKQEIGKGELIISNSVGTYTKGIFTLDYSMRKKASYITIVFLSSNAASPATLAIKGNKGAWNAGYGDSRHIGSVLTVDDVNLIY